MVTPVVNAYCLDTFEPDLRPWRKLIEINIEPCADLDQIVALYR